MSRQPLAEKNQEEKQNTNGYESLLNVSGRTVNRAFRLETFRETCFQLVNVELHNILKFPSLRSAVLRYEPEQVAKFFLAVFFLVLGVTLISFLVD